MLVVILCHDEEEAVAIATRQTIRAFRLCPGRERQGPLLANQAIDFGTRTLFRRPTSAIMAKRNEIACAARDAGVDRWCRPL
jgi:hypothetical protein